jgi:hypothetical protein
MALEMSYRIARAYVLLSICLLLHSCSFSAAPGGSSLTKEADKLAREYWYAGFSKCGDYYYALSISAPAVRITRGVLFQYKDLVIETKPGKITQADELNGIEWKGTSYLNPVAYREYLNESKKWTKWYNVAPSGPPLYINIIKQNGIWSVGKNVVEEAKYQKVDCGDIPE